MVPLNRRQSVDKALLQSEERMRALYNAVPVPIYIWQKTGDDFVLIDYNNAALTFTKAKVGDFVGQSASEMYRNMPEIIEEMSRCLDEKTVIQREMLYQLNSTDEVKHLAVQYVFVPPDLVLVHTEDITEREQAEKALQEAHDNLEVRVRERTAELRMANKKLRREIEERERAEEEYRKSEERYRELFNSIMEGIGLVDENEVIQYCNPAYAEIFEAASAEDMIGKNLMDYMPESQKDIVLSQTALRRTNVPSQYELEITTAKNNKKSIFVSISPRFDKQNKYVGAFGCIIDITDRKQAEEVLRESEERFRTVADFAYDWDYWIDPDGRYVYMSPSCERITGYCVEDFLGDPTLLESITHPDDRAILDEHPCHKSDKNESCVIEFRIITRGGRERWVEHMCRPVSSSDGRFLGRRVSNRDITERRRMEEEIAKMEKLKSLGVLAGGIAHDFNNIMTAILGNVSIAKLEVDSQSELYERLSDAEKAISRAQDLTSQFITFSKGGAPVKQEFSIAELVTESARFVLSGSNVRIEFSIPDDLPSVNIDRGQINQVISNLVINADQAMPGGGVIRISAENVSLREEDSIPLKAGNYVRISIKDEGVGIPEEHIRNIFDPYYTTKQKGSGLGLAVTYSIIRGHNGHINVESELGKGTRFHIYLPVSGKPCRKEKKIDELKPATGTGRVLIMDDDEAIRRMAGMALKNLGYDIGLARDGDEAIAMYLQARDSGQPFDVVFMDLTIPGGIGAKEAMAKLLKIDPGVKALVSSGYSTDPVVADYKDYGFKGTIPKPYNVRQLSRALHDVMLTPVVS